MLSIKGLPERINDMMTKEVMIPLYRKASRLIDRYRKGRTIVVLGEAKTYHEFLAQDYGMTNVMTVTTVKKKANDKVRYIGEIKDMNDRYYIVVPRMKKMLDLQLRLHSFGYTDFEDCFFINHNKISVDDYIEDYSDEYGNHIHAPHCKVVLDEYAYDVQIDIDESCTFGENNQITAKTVGGAKVKIGRKCVFEDGVNLTVFGDAEVNIGEKTTFVRNTEMTVLGGMTLNIGKDCLFSFEIKIYCGDGHAIYDVVKRERINKQEKGDPKNIIEIGDHVWVGMRSIILNKTVIGRSSIVGAGALVKGEFPNNCILAGMPAKVIRKDITWSAESLRNTMDHIPAEYIALTEEEN